MDWASLLSNPAVRNALITGGVGALSGGAAGYAAGGENAVRNALLGALLGGTAGGAGGYYGTQGGYLPDIASKTKELAGAGKRKVKGLFGSSAKPAPTESVLAPAGEEKGKSGWGTAAKVLGIGALGAGTMLGGQRLMKSPIGKRLLDGVRVGKQASVQSQQKKTAAGISPQQYVAIMERLNEGVATPPKAPGRDFILSDGKNPLKSLVSGTGDKLNRSYIDYPGGSLASKGDNTKIIADFLRQRNHNPYIGLSAFDNPYLISNPRILEFIERRPPIIEIDSRAINRNGGALVPYGQQYSLPKYTESLAGKLNRVTRQLARRNPIATGALAGGAGTLGVVEAAKRLFSKKEASTQKKKRPNR